MKIRKLKLFGLAALLTFIVGCETDGDYGGSGSVNFYGSVGYYDSFYDPWYGGGGVIVCPPDRPVSPSRPTVTPHMGGGRRR